MAERAGYLIDTEHAILSTALGNPKKIGQMVASIDTEDFTGLRRSIFDGIKTLYFAGKAVDPVTLSYRLDVIRNGACLTQLYWDASSGAPTIDCRKDSAIKRSMSGTFICNDAVDLFSDELRPMMIIDGIEEALGIYRPTTVLDTYTPYGKAWQLVEYVMSLFL